MLEVSRDIAMMLKDRAAAILAHLGPAGHILPSDKSLWPAMLSPPEGEPAQLRRLSRDQSSMLSPPSSVIAPLTPSSLRDIPNLAKLDVAAKNGSPGSNSTTSSDSYVPQASPPAPSSLGIRQNGHHIRRPEPTLSSSVPGPIKPQSIGSLPDMTGLHFHTGITTNGVSPIPNRGMPLSLTARTGMIGGGMFGSINTVVQSSSIRSGADDDDDDLVLNRGKSSSEEAEERRKAREGEEWGMAMEMEL